MYTINKITGILIILFSVITSCVTTHNIDSGNDVKGFMIQVTKDNTLPKHYKKILVKGFGGSSARFFFDNIYAALSAELLKENVTTAKEFNKNDSLVVTANGNNYAPGNSYDAILLVSTKSLKDRENNLAAPISANAFEHIFKFALFDNPGENTSIWELNLNAHVDFTQAGSFKKIAEKILENMRWNKLLK